MVMWMQVVKLLLFAVSILLAVYSSSSFGHRVLTCEPEWAALAGEIGGTLVTVRSATTGLQDPHRIEARPSLIAMIRTADLVICTGMGVEDGWLPLLLLQSGNAKVQPGQLGYLVAGDYVEKLDIPRRLDRAEGDVHAQGNHHIQGDPRNFLILARVLAQRLGEIDPPHRADFQAREQAFSARWSEAIKRWEERAAPLKGVSFVEHHRAWPYLSRWLGMQEVGTLEPKPGIEPTVAHLQSLLASLKQEPARFIVRASYNSPRASEWLAEQTGLPVVVLPTTIGGNERAKDLFSLFADIIERLLAPVAQ